VGGLEGEWFYLKERKKWSEWLGTQRRRLIVRELTTGTGRIIWHGRKA
jgi:hypothetical protein